MPLRVAVLATGRMDPAALQASLRDLLLPVRVCRILCRVPLLAAIHLIRFRPHLLVSDAAGAGAVLALLYRMLRPQARLLVCAQGTAVDGWASGWARRHADAWAAQDDQVPDALERFRFADRFQPMPVPDDVALFAACPRHRGGGDAYRVIYAGDLSPESGAADVFLGLCAWAERHPEREVDIRWLGDGDLVGVLETQPLPDNLRQRFITALDRQGLAACFADCGILIAPSVADGRVPLVAEALAAGLIVLIARRPGSGHAAAPDLSFDPARPDEVIAAFTDILGRPVPELDIARDRGRAMLQRSLRGQPVAGRYAAKAAAST